MKKVPIIMLTPARFRDLQKAVGKSRSAVYMALRYATNGPEPELIREKAIKEYGGVKTQKIVY